MRIAACTALIFAVPVLAAVSDEKVSPDIQGDTLSETVEERAEDMSVASVAGSFKIALPSGKRGLTDWTRYEGPVVTLNLGLLIIGDYNMFDQDSSSIVQVGEIDDESELRAGRLMFRGRLGKGRAWSYFYAGEYNGLSREPDDSRFRTTDLAFTRNIGSLGDLTIGKTKETIHLARIMPGDGVLLMERATMDALIPSRGTGVKLGNHALDRRMTWSVGWFNDWLFTDENFDESDNIFTGRVTGLPVFADNGQQLIHLGLALRYAEAEDDSFHFREPPEANTAPNFLDTGEFPAKSSETISLEFGTVHNSLSFQAEYLTTQINSREVGDPRFNGWYVASSWILTGESRSYLRRGGFFFKLDPQRPLGSGGRGAVELTARISNTDLNDAQIEGGEFTRWSLGANWYLTSAWRLEVNYGQGELKRFDTIGDTEFLQFRVQWAM